MSSIDRVIAVFRGPDWKTWLGHTAQWAGAILLGLGAAWLVTLVTATWLDLYVLATGCLLGWLWGGWHFARREFGPEGDFHAYRATRDWDGMGDSVMDFVVPFLLATALLYAIGRWVLGIA